MGSLDGQPTADGIFPLISAPDRPAAQLFARASRFATDDTCHWPPRAVRMPRSFSRLAMATMPIGPADWMLRMIGSIFAANLSASARRARRPTWPASAILVGLPSASPRCFFGGQCCACALGNEPTLLFEPGPHTTATWRGQRHGPVRRR